MLLAFLTLFTLSATVTPGSVSAHVIMGTKSLHLRMVEAKLVVRARVVDPYAVFVSEDGGTRRALIEIEILEVLKGSTLADPSNTAAARIRFAQDGHDVPRYRIGQEALFFLAPIGDSRELSALIVPGGPSHVSSEEHDQFFALDSREGPVLLSAARALAAAESATTAADRVALIRSATMDLLTSGDSRLGASALASLVLTPQAALVTRADLPRLEKVLADPTVSVGFRAGLIAELERRGLVDGPPRWLALVKKAPASDLGAAIRAVGNHPSEELTSYLAALLADPETPPEIAAEAAMALGASRDDAVVATLTKALEAGEPRVRGAAIRGLGQIDGPKARRALEGAARTHPDPSTRRRALAELRTDDKRSERAD